MQRRVCFDLNVVGMRVSTASRSKKARISADRPRDSENTENCGALSPLRCLERVNLRHSSALGLLPLCPQEPTFTRRSGWSRVGQTQASSRTEVRCVMPVGGVANNNGTRAAAPGFLPALIDAGNGVTFTMLGTTMRLIATGAETGGRYTVGEQIMPLALGTARHVHSREDEILYVLEGTYEVQCGDVRRTVSPGACAVLPRGVPHGFRNAGLTPARLMFVITPSGLENYFIALSKFGSSPPGRADLAKLADSFGLTFPPGQ
jgi:mannose-6-phosphate isomerase-like protein (cupin superfamily)